MDRCHFNKYSSYALKVNPRLAVCQALGTASQAVLGQTHALNTAAHPSLAPQDINHTAVIANPHAPHTLVKHIKKGLGVACRVSCLRGLKGQAGADHLQALGAFTANTSC